MSNPFISVIVPCRNEESFIANCLDSILTSSYRIDLMEILCVDGLSSDRTPEIIYEFQKQFSMIRLINNPKEIFPSAVNIGVKESKGELIFIVGAHAVYDKNYISKCVERSYEFDADNVGGVLNTKENEPTIYGKIIIFVLSSSFGVGNSTFRTGSSGITEADSVFGGCYKRRVFEKNGYFNEKLISTSDYEFNKRLRRNGGKIILDPSIKADYYTRTTFRKFVFNNIRNGFWAIYPILLVNYIPVSARHFVPLLFTISLISTSLLSIFYHPLIYIFYAILGLYFLFSVLFASIKNNNSYKVLAPLFFFLLHITYGLGSLWALIKIGLVKCKLLNV